MYVCSLSVVIIYRESAYLLIITMHRYRKEKLYLDQASLVVEGQLCLQSTQHFETLSRACFLRQEDLYISKDFTHVYKLLKDIDSEVNHICNKETFVYKGTFSDYFLPSRTRRE